MCGHDIAADTICREMNFTHATRWTHDQSFDIETIETNYNKNLDSVHCTNAKWESCLQYFGIHKDNCKHSKSIFLGGNSH